MFENLQQAPPDPILGLTDAFKRDPNPAKINLGVGVFQDESGKTPTLECVKRAEARLLEQGAAKTYLPIEGAAEYGKHVRSLLFGDGDARVGDGRAVSAHTPGGTGGLRVAGDLAKARLGLSRVLLSDPTWANHQAIFQAAGLAVDSYPYYDPQTHGLAFERMLDALGRAGPSDLVLLHTCCHNPSGVDPSPEQWRALADVAQRRGFLTLFDFAYQGFGDGLEQDAAPVRLFAERGLELMICSSFSKNFGLYNERVGALTLLAHDKQAGERALSQLKATIRSNYSNPPTHGGAIVQTVLGDAELSALWRRELDGMRESIAHMRRLFVEGLKHKGVSQDFSFITRQKGMFSFLGISPEQVDRLRDEFGIYVVRSGRANVAGMSESSMDRLCGAVAAVLK
jgi:aspartate/tyrosine/aromatic aminotransferase